MLNYDQQAQNVWNKQELIVNLLLKSQVPILLLFQPCRTAMKSFSWRGCVVQAMKNKENIFSFLDAIGRLSCSHQGNS